ncbi:MAG: haloalkane dehalogenase [Candidatus Omnitrophica bacterium]|nr:haloalkane dehalogenase [Candidatus Omnitrophota bacterium]
MAQEQIPDAFPYQSRFVTVHGSSMHYVDEGKGETFVFIHGNPTSSYLWRNVIAHLSESVRCIAPDLIGMGLSEKPDIEYTLQDQLYFFHGLIKALNLKKMTLVMHEYGSLLGFAYAQRHPDQIKALVFMEAVVKPLESAQLPEEYRQWLAQARDPVKGPVRIIRDNLFVEKKYSEWLMRPMSEFEKEYFEEPFLDLWTRKPVWQCLQDMPIDDQPEAVTEIVRNYTHYLMTSDCPKLLLWVHPGVLISEAVADWCRGRFKNLSVIDCGEAGFYLPENIPQEIGLQIAEWHRIKNGS